ncbi:MAG: DMT family transporter [Roseovarius sp.]|nr:DMT family transporter [Roseovarius sp.]MCY4209256.1 DMT family transporter [Roseovarius sp.]MCY4292046.1 DMT family transporter [Roseovarius sp.]MCY4315053.1 DMT family transporter [Roseovarius sp.]
MAGIGRSSGGILLMACFALVAPGMDACAKLIGDALAVGQVVATRFSIQFALLFPLAAAFGWLHRPRSNEIWLHMARGALILIATAFFFVALRYMPIADAISIFFVEPFILALLGGIILGERVGPRRYAACAAGFLGAMMVIQPSFREVGATALLPLVTAFSFALYMILTRRMARRMHPVSMQVYTGLAACVLVFPLLFLFDGSGIHALDPSWPGRREIWLLAGIGLIATLSHLCIGFALSLAPASLLAPIQYLEIAGATVLGYAIFSDLPDLPTFAGILLIVGSGLFVFFRERHLERRIPPPP